MTPEELPDHLQAKPSYSFASVTGAPIFVVYAVDNARDAVIAALELMRQNAKSERTIEIRNQIKLEADAMRPHAPATAAIFDEVSAMLEELDTSKRKPGRLFALVG